MVGVLGRRPRIPASCPPELRSLICDCWQRDARARPPFAAILGRLQARCPCSCSACSRFVLAFTCNCSARLLVQLVGVLPPKTAVPLGRLQA